MSILFNNKEYFSHRNILLSFDCLVDVDFGFIKFIIYKFPNIIKYNDKESFNNGDNAIKNILLNKSSFTYNPLVEFISRDTTSMYTEIIEKYYKDILNNSCLTSLSQTMVLAGNMNDYKITISCNNDDEYDYILNVFKDYTPKNVIFSKDKIDYDSYDTIFLKYGFKLAELELFNKNIYLPIAAWNVDTDKHEGYIRDFISDIYPIELITLYSPYNMDDTYYSRG